MRRISRTIIAGAAAAAMAVPAARAVTKAEWEADPSLIPDPATGPFYLVGAEPSPAAGRQTVEAYGMGFDSSPTERIYDLDFRTRFSTRPFGTMLILR